MLRSTFDGQSQVPTPYYLYFSFVINTCENVASDTRIDPPTHTAHFRSSGIITFIDVGANVSISLSNLSLIPETRCPSRQDYIPVQLPPHVNVELHDLILLLFIVFTANLETGFSYFYNKYPRQLFLPVPTQKTLLYRKKNHSFR